MTMQLRKAERKQAKMRISISGPSGSGKTWSGLVLSRGLVDKWEDIALIDTENKRGDIYSDMGAYNIITLEAPFSPERCIEAIHACEKAGMKVIIFDSLSHEWEGPGGALEINENLANAKYKGNTWAAWNETTPRHRALIDTIIQSPCHILATMRSKTDVIQTEDKKIKKVGLKDIQREGFEYEMTVSFNIDRETHMALAGKDNTQLFGSDPFKISIETGKQLRSWVESGKVDLTNAKRAVIVETRRLEYPDMAKNITGYRERIKKDTSLELTDENVEAILVALKAMPTAVAPVAIEEAELPTAPQLPITSPAASITSDAASKVDIEKPLTEDEKETLKVAAEFDRAIADKANPEIVDIIRVLAKDKLGFEKSDEISLCNYIFEQFKIEIRELITLTPEEAKLVIDHLTKLSTKV